MCTQVHLVLPDGSDVAAVGALVERHKVGRGLDRPGREAPTLVEGEHAYLVVPWKRCHCGWGSRDFVPVVRDALEARAAPWLGVFVLEQGYEHDGTRIVLTLDELSSLEDDDEEDALYIVEPLAKPPVVRRHGPRRRRRS